MSTTTGMAGRAVTERHDLTRPPGHTLISRSVYPAEEETVMPIALALKVVRWLLEKHTYVQPLGPVVVGLTWRPPFRVSAHDGYRVWGAGLPHVFVWVRRA